MPISHKFKNDCKLSCALTVEFVRSLSICGRHEDVSSSESGELDNLLCHASALLLTTNFVKISSK